MKKPPTLCILFGNNVQGCGWMVDGEGASYERTHHYGRFDHDDIHSILSDADECFSCSRRTVLPLLQGKILAICSLNRARARMSFETAMKRLWMLSILAMLRRPRLSKEKRSSIPSKWSMITRISLCAILDKVLPHAQAMPHAPYSQRGRYRSPSPTNNARSLHHSTIGTRKV